MTFSGSLHWVPGVAAPDLQQVLGHEGKVQREPGWCELYTPHTPHPAHQLIYCPCLFEIEVNCRSWHASIFVCLAPSTPLSPAMSGQFPFYILFLLFLILHSSVENRACDMF